MLVQRYFGNQFYPEIHKNIAEFVPFDCKLSEIFSEILRVYTSPDLVVIESCLNRCAEYVYRRIATYIRGMHVGLGVNDIIEIAYQIIDPEPDYDDVVDVSCKEASAALSFHMTSIFRDEMVERLYSWAVFDDEQEQSLMGHHVERKGGDRIPCTSFIREILLRCVPQGK